MGQGQRPTGEGGTRWTGPSHGKVWGRRDSRAEALTWGEVGAFVEQSLVQGEVQRGRGVLASREEVPVVCWERWPVARSLPPG